MGDTPQQPYAPPEPVVVSAVMHSHGEFHLWQVETGLWHWHNGCAKVAAAGFFQTVCEQLVDFPEGGYRVDVRGVGSARSLIAEAWAGVNSSRPYPRAPSYVLGASMWALARNGISFGFVDTVGKVKLMAKAGKKGDTGPEQLPSAAQNGSVSFMFHDVVLLDCTYQIQGSNIRVRIDKSHITGSLEALLTTLAGVAAPVLRGDASTSKAADAETGELLQLELSGIIDQLAPKPIGPPVTSHDGKQADVPAVAGKLEHVQGPTSDQTQAAAQVDALAASMNQSADGGASTELDELPFDVLGGLDPVQDLGDAKDGEQQMIELDDAPEELTQLEQLGDDESQTTELLADADSPELATIGNVTAEGQADIRHRPDSGAASDDTQIEVEDIDLEEAQPLDSQSDADGDADGLEALEGDPVDDGSDAPPPVVGQVGDDELDALPEPVGSPKADKKTKASVAEAAAAKSTKAAATQQSAVAAAKSTENTVPGGKVENVQEIPGVRIPSAKELSEYVKQLSEASQTSVVNVRDKMTAKFTTLELLDAQANKLIGAKWTELRPKFVGKSILLAHRFLLGAFIAQLIKRESTAAKK